MGVRRAVVAAVTTLGIIVPLGPGAVAAGNDDPPATKRERLEQLHDRSSGSTTTTPIGRGVSKRLNVLAAQPDPSKVVLSVKVRGGARLASALTDVARASAAKGGVQRHALRQLGTVSVEVPRAVAPVFAAQLRQRADVARVDVVGRKSMAFVPDDERYASTAPYLDAVAAPSAWDVQRGDAAVSIAVIDSGVDVGHPDLAGRVTGAYNAVDGTTDVTDEVGHGTFVAGVAAATGDNTIGIAGASLGSSVLAVKVADSSGQVWSDAEAAGILWAADHGAKVINLSLSSTAADQVESEAVAYARSKGVLVVAAAGNDGVSTPSYPAAYPGVVAVGATDAAGHRASFSQFGSWVTVAAPGTTITSTTPRAGSDFFPADYATADGTSFSTPLVAAEAALLWSHRPDARAADVRAAIVGTAHGYAGLGLGAGQVDFRASMDALAPDTVPGVTAPAGGSVVSGVVALSATSTAARVRFEVDGTRLGNPVATTGGVAGATWTTWGLANGAHTIRAFDCSALDLCNPIGAEVAVTLGNAAPVITAPKPSQTVSGSTTFTATAPGGAVAFVVDGVRRGLDTTAPYTLAYPVSALTDGTHTVRAVSCSAAGACAGPASAVVSFRNQSLHPRFTSVSPSVFSPNSDRRSDTVKLTFSLPDSEAVIYSVRNAAGTVVRGPVGLGTLPAGSRSFVWNGLLNGGARATSGTYRVELSTYRTTSTGTLRGAAAVNVRVDMAAPTMATVTGTGSLFYPYPDSYRDTFTPAFTLNEASVVTMTVRSSSGAVVRTLTSSRPAGRTSMTWNGRTASGALVAAGTYSWTLMAQDAAGNRRTGARYTVTVSGKRLVMKTVTLTKQGAQLTSAGGSDESCSGASLSMSDFYPTGVWLDNVCDPDVDGFQLAAATYRFGLPAAVGYGSIKIQSYGNSLAASPIGAGFTRWGTVDYTFTPSAATGTSNAWRTIGTVSAAGVVSTSRIVEATVFVPNVDYENDYDIGLVRIVATYRVLA